MIGRARRRGELRDGNMIIESTSGTLGLGLALAGMVYQHPVTLVSDPGMEPMMHQLLSAYGARVETVTDPHPVGGWQQARRDRVSELMSQHRGAYNPDQYNNPDNVGAYAGLAHELVAQLGRIDVLVASVGTGGHSAGVSQVLRRYFPQLRLVGVDTIGSTIFGQPARARIMRGLGSSIHPGNVAYPSFSEVHWVGPSEAVWAARLWPAASTPAVGGAWERWPWSPGGWRASCRRRPGSPRSSPTARTATSTPSTTTTTAVPTTWTSTCWRPSIRPTSITRTPQRSPPGPDALPSSTPPPRHHPSLIRWTSRW